MNALNTAVQETAAQETVLSLAKQLKAQLPLSYAHAQQIAEVCLKWTFWGFAFEEFNLQLTIPKHLKAYAIKILLLS